MKKLGSFIVFCLVLNIKDIEIEREREKDYMIIFIIFNFMV